ncbi:MAG: hypothetical protein JO033_23015 [Acidobacteriaceae bacterium]|nr:hypothetical protein [Acidobacteriaceae bacterium]MBV9502493.1 hypothetical protein [Acidobacteriaceae bacterium]
MVPLITGTKGGEFAVLPLVTLLSLIIEQQKPGAIGLLSATLLVLKLVTQPNLDFTWAWLIVASFL